MVPRTNTSCQIKFSQQLIRIVTIQNALIMYVLRVLAFGLNSYRIAANLFVHYVLSFAATVPGDHF